MVYRIAVWVTRNFNQTDEWAEAYASAFSLAYWIPYFDKKKKLCYNNIVRIGKHI